MDDSDSRSNGHVQPERKHARRDVHSHWRIGDDNLEVDSLQSAMLERYGGCDRHGQAAGNDGDCWAESNYSTGRYNGAAWRQHTVVRDGYVVHSYSRSNRHIQPERINAECDVDPYGR